MQDSKEGPPESSLGRPKEHLIIRTLGFHYTVDSLLPKIFQHGLLSRLEEEKRGLQARERRSSRSQPDQVYFTTRINDLYFLRDAPDQTLDEALRDIVGIAVDRPQLARTCKGPFVINNIVEREKFRALVIIDTEVSPKDQYTHGAYEFGDPLSEEAIRARVESLRIVCQQAGVDLPIYGVSGDMYYPERKTRSEIREAAIIKDRNSSS